MENLSTSKLTGGRRHPLRTRRKYEIDRYPNEPLAGEQVTVTRKVRGKNRKTALKAAGFANLSAPGSPVKRARITKVLENPTNNDYRRRGVVTRGAVLETEAGKCRVVSRPGQSGTVSAVLIE